jgi:hypothetical protein
VQAPYQGNHNHTQYDNWSTRGNVNPYTGYPGTRMRRYQVILGEVSYVPAHVS